MLADYGVGGYSDNGEGFALGALDGPRFTCVKNTGDNLVFLDPDGSIFVTGKQTQHAQCHVGAAAGGTGRNHLGTRPATTNGIERQRQIGIVLVRVVALNFKVLSGINKSAADFANRIGVTYIYIAAQAGAQQRVEAAVHGDNVIALPC